MRCKSSLIQILQLRILCTDHLSMLVSLPKCHNFCDYMSNLSYSPLVGQVSQHHRPKTSKHNEQAKSLISKGNKMSQKVRNYIFVIQKIPCHIISDGRWRPRFSQSTPLGRVLF